MFSEHPTTIKHSKNSKGTSSIHGIALSSDYIENIVLINLLFLMKFYQGKPPCSSWMFISAMKSVSVHLYTLSIFFLNKESSNDFYMKDRNFYTKNINLPYVLKKSTKFFKIWGTKIFLKHQFFKQNLKTIIFLV